VLREAQLLAGEVADAGAPELQIPAGACEGEEPLPDGDLDRPEPAGDADEEPVHELRRLRAVDEAEILATGHLELPRRPGEVVERGRVEGRGGRLDVRTVGHCTDV
jgi:hypothetical protein